MTALPDVARAIEHTLLKPEAQPAAIEALAGEAREHGFHGVCVNPLHVACAARTLAGAPAVVVSVVAFPLGATVPAIAAAEGARALEDGAAELDLVIPVGLALAGDLAAVEASVAAVRGATGDAPLKVILETGFFAPEALHDLCRAAVQGGCDFLKTSTGFGPRGATVEDVEHLAQHGVAVKAAGGIRDLTSARALLAAGASRLGTSRGVALVTGRGADGDY